jgi:hypothetical protein
MKVTFYYPSADFNGKPIVNREMVMLSHIKQICTISGGVTVDNNSQGFWNNAQGNLISEYVNRVTIHTEKSKLPALIEVFQNVKETLQQESVLYELNDKAVFL